MLDDSQQPSEKPFPQGKALSGRVVDIPSAAEPDFRSSVRRPPAGGLGGGTEPGDTTATAASPTDELADQQHCCLSSAGNMSTSLRSGPPEGEAGKGDGDQEQPHPRENPASDETQRQQRQQQRQRYAENPRRASGGSGRNEGTGGGTVGKGRRRVRMRQGETPVSSRARAGLLGVLGPGGGRGYLAINGPIATGSSKAARGRDGGSGNEGGGGESAGGETC